MGRRFKLRDLPMVVNGDDILFSCENDVMYENWKKITAFCGLKFSLGKNYTSKRFLVINSELYRVGRRSVMKVPILNYRLVLGGTRSSSEGLALKPCDEQQSIKSLHQADPVRRRKNLESRISDEAAEKAQLDKSDLSAVEAYCLKQATRTYKENRPSRYEDYKKWFLTLPQRQQIFVKQLTGDYKIDETFVENALSRFRRVQIQKNIEFDSEFPRKVGGLSLSNYIPRVLGGLGLIPPRGFQYSVLDAAFLQVCKENTQLALDAAKRITPALTRSSMMKRISSTVSKLSDELGLQWEMVPMSEWDECLERYGEEENPFNLSTIHGFVGAQVVVTQDERVLCFDEALDPDNIKVVRKLRQLAREREARFMRKAVVSQRGWTSTTVQIYCNNISSGCCELIARFPRCRVK